MTALTERIPLDEITAQAEAVRPGRAALTVVAAVLFGLGWVTARVFSVLWLAAMWSGVAVREGWRASHGPSRKAQIEALTAMVKEQEKRLERFVIQ